MGPKSIAIEGLMIQGNWVGRFPMENSNFVLLGVQKLPNLPLGKDDVYKSIINISIYIYYIYKQIIIKDTCTDDFQSSIGNLPTYLDVNFLAGGNKDLNRKAFPLEVNLEDFLYRK
jgi:hypothetical protein